MTDERHDREEGASPEPRQSVSPFRSASRTPAWRARAAGRSVEEAEEGRASAGRGEIRRRAPDLHLGRHASWNSHSGKKLFSTTPRLTGARFSARCCFAFYTGVEIWSLDSPMHHRSGPPLTERTGVVLLLQERSVSSRTALKLVNIPFVKFCASFIYGFVITYCL
ncbi:PREDICTED: uncharacterized protein LOC105566639 [Vollenhovia emeryi]|uniref:uncharacterized protein LOC105566639 n=1 Tax=Vollenhovia emeryi TaxID=411798 RepID=UPI0005F53DC3|nr:PREDICTED: uncharacterized protein LOC105566639 [Vollenhovia emeryi]